MTTRGALVLAGGGVAGIAWETGVLFGIQQVDAGLIDRIVSPATTIIGTSAGSTVAAQVATGEALSDLFDRQTSAESAELQIEFDVATLVAAMGGAMKAAASPEDGRRRMGDFAREADTVPPEVRRAVIAARLLRQEWTDQPLLIPAIDAATGQLRVFDRASGVGLVDAVTASCAIPGIWPPVEIDGRLYIDGGTRTSSNADLAAGAEQVLIIAPSAEEGPLGSAVTQAERDALAPARVFTIFADDASIAAMGANPLDPASRPPAARAGQQIGHAIAGRLAAFWA